MVAKDEDGEVVGEEEIIKGKLEEEEVSTKHQTRLQYWILRVKWNNLARF